MSRTEEVTKRIPAAKQHGRVRSLSLLVAAAAICSIAVAMQTSASKAPAREIRQTPDTSQKTAEQVYKNIKVLNGLPASELDGVMYFMSAALGVGCTHCHTNPWDSDVRSAKLAARKMIVMTRDLNKESFSGNPAITCYTCHRGQPHSVPLPPAEVVSSQPPEAEAATAAKPPALPTSDEVVSRYIQAIGGESAIDRIKTRVMRGSETIFNRMTAPVTIPIEIYQTSKNKMLIIRTASVGSSFEGFDGSRGWRRDPRGLREIDSKGLAEARRSAEFFRYLKITETYPRMRVLAREKVGSREAYVIGATSRDDSREKLYFDVNTGLLIRREVVFKTAFGGIPEITDFDDYREIGGGTVGGGNVAGSNVGGVKVPFTIIWSRPPFGSLQKFTEIMVNVSVDDSRFEPGAK